MKNINGGTIFNELARFQEDLYIVAYSVHSVKVVNYLFLIICNELKHWVGSQVRRIQPRHTPLTVAPAVSV